MTGARGRGPGPSVTWAGAVIKLDTGETHALEFNGDFITADVKLSTAPGETSSVWLQGHVRHWVEAERFAREDGVARALEGAPRAVESEVM